MYVFMSIEKVYLRYKACCAEYVVLCAARWGLWSFAPQSRRILQSGVCNLGGVLHNHATHSALQKFQRKGLEVE